MRRKRPGTAEVIRKLREADAIAASGCSRVEVPAVRFIRNDISPEFIARRWEWLETCSLIRERAT